MASPENADVPILTVSMQLTASQALLIPDWMDSRRGRQTSMVEIPRASLFVAREIPPAPQLQRELFWQQVKPVESAIEWVDPASQEHLLFVLSDGTLSRMRSENGAWKPLDTTGLPAVRRHSRSGDGSFVYTDSAGSLGILLDGKVCALKLEERVSFACAGVNPPTTPLRILSACEEMPRYLATSAQDYAQPDRIILRSPVVSQAAPPPKEGDASSVEVPGPVLSITVAGNIKAAFAVVRNLSTGIYEVYRITAVCGN
jgi:hypothetical protein